MTDTFVTELPLRVTPAQEKALNKRFEAARQVYNACLGEGLKRLDLMRQSKQWQAARKMKKGKERNQAFKDCWASFGLEGKYCLHKYVHQFKRSWLGNHLGTRSIKTIATKAFVWIKEYAFDPDRGRPRFKQYGEYNSVESSEPRREILLEQAEGEYFVHWPVGMLWNPELNKFQDRGLIIKMKTIVDLNNETIAHGLSCRLKYIRIVRRDLNGKIRFYAQLVNEGQPLKRFKLGCGVVGLDLGPSTVAIVGPDKARLKLFCEELEDSKIQERRLLRKIDRQRRANNPCNYNEDGTGKPRGKCKPWVKSNRQRQTEKKLKEVRRKQREYRKSLHGQLINQIIQMGDVVRLEKLSYEAFQKMFGKSVGIRAPGQFASRLRQKMHDYGGLVEEFSTYHTKLSQIDHKTGEYQKKPLSQRWHRFSDGERVQRDLYSAFLAACVEDGKLQKALIDSRWSHVKPLLDQAVLGAKYFEKRPSSFGF